MKKSITIILLLTFLSSYCQQKTLAKFIITDASHNGNDTTEIYLEAGGYIAFYTQADGNLYMTNIMSKRKNSQSFGRLYSSEHSMLKETYENYEADIFFYRWRYNNTYNNNKGTATIELTKIYKPQGVTFICKIIPENLDVLIYKGYMEGTLDLNRFSN